MDHDDPRIDSTPVELTSEFASVLVGIDRGANGPRLCIENRQNGAAIFLDPLELASLTWLRHRDLGPFLDPSRTGWRNYEEMTDDDA